MKIEKKKKKEPTPHGCPLTSTCVHTLIIIKILKEWCVIPQLFRRHFVPGASSVSIHCSFLMTAQGADGKQAFLTTPAPSSRPALAFPYLPTASVFTFHLPNKHSVSSGQQNPPWGSTVDCRQSLRFPSQLQLCTRFLTFA